LARSSDVARSLPADWIRFPKNGTRPDPRRSGLVVLVVVGTGVDPVTFRFSGGRSAN
jgi:hypothetical protein